MIEHLRPEILELARAIVHLADSSNVNRTILSRLDHIEKVINMKANELAAQLQGVKDQVDKVKKEITDRIAALEASLANVDLPVEATTALEALKASVQSVDDITPDVPPPTP